MQEEYVSLRDEIMKWQDRRIFVSQLSMTLVIAYTGFLISKDTNEINLSSQILSILTLSILSVTMHVVRLFELFGLKAAAFTAVFHKSIWEKNTTRISFSDGILKFGYNKSMAVAYLIIAFSSVIILFRKFPCPLYTYETIVFILSTVLFAITFLRLFLFNTHNKKEELIKLWRNIRNEQL